MLKTKTTKKNIIDRVINLDKAINTSKQPSLVIIDREKEGEWIIKEHYYTPSSTPSYKTLYYKDYKEYLNNLKLDRKIPIIINDLPLEYK